jgi:hypothetical protein
MQVVSKRLKYNLHYKQKNWIETLSSEAETAINNLNITDEQYYKNTGAKTIMWITQESRNKNSNKNKR